MTLQHIWKVTKCATHWDFTNSSHIFPDQIPDPDVTITLFIDTKYYSMCEDD